MGPLANTLLASHSSKTLLVGGSETADINIPAEYIADTRGKLGLREFIAAIDASEIVVTTHSGPFHIPAL